MAFRLQAFHIPNIRGISLCHFADDTIRSLSTSQRKILISIDKNSPSESNFGQIDLSRGNIDCNEKLRDVLSKNYQNSIMFHAHDFFWPSVY